jgi:6-phosphogluconate dehydrogenase
MSATGDIAVIGLAVMGQNLILNMNDHGFTVVAYNRTTAKVDNSWPTKPRARRSSARIPSRKWSQAQAPAPRHDARQGRQAVDEFIEQLIPHLEPGDIIIDGGNSLFPTPTAARNTSRARACSTSAPASAAAKKARAGPSIMPGGSPAAWPHVKEIFQAVSAKVEAACRAATGSAKWARAIT